MRLLYLPLSLRRCSQADVLCGKRFPVPRRAWKNYSGSILLQNVRRSAHTSVLKCNGAGACIQSCGYDYELCVERACQYRR